MKIFKEDVRDLVNFLDYIGEPAKAYRYSLGWKVIAFLFIFLIFAILLKKEYWRDIH
ncbi:MAG: cytochrome c1 [Thiomargarita sp.]|nr:cytochrome c1 [Thiomargarita sp.]